MNQSFENDLTKKMSKAIIILEKELSGLRTGRSSTNLLDPVIVEVYGKKMILSQIATILTPDAKTISVQVWDKALVKIVEKAISDANLGLNPSSDGQIIRITLPILSQERRRELVKIAYKYGENTKVSLRNIRRDGMENLKKMEKGNAISKDVQRSVAEEIQKIITNFSNVVDSHISVKEKEILKV